MLFKFICEPESTEKHLLVQSVSDVQFENPDPTIGKYSHEQIDIGQISYVSGSATVWS